MKNYYSFQMNLKVNDQDIVGQDQNFAQKAAIEHRVAKASWFGEKPFSYQDPHKNDQQKSSSSNFLGAGSYKKVFETPGRQPGVTKNIEFILAKLDCGKNGRRGAWNAAQDAIDDMIKNMVFYNNPRTSLFATFGDDSVPRIYLYLPRIKGHDLSDLISKRKGVLDNNLRIRYFFDICKELKVLHRAGFYHADLKPANIMADPDEGASLIDFGAVKRCWHPYTVRTPSYCILMEDYRTRFASKYSAFRPKSTNLVNYLKALEKISNVFKDYKSDLGRKYTRLVFEHNDIERPFIFGAAYDTAALVLIAMELGLWNDKTDSLFLNLISSFFMPCQLEPILAELRKSYTGNISLDTPPKLKILQQANVIEVIASAQPGIEPANVRETIRSRYLAKVDADAQSGALTSEQADEAKSILDIVDMCFVLFSRFSSINHIYKQSELDRNKSVDTKRLALTQLINALTYISNVADLRTNLTKMFAISLVNTGSFKTRARPESFSLLFRAVKEPNIINIVRDHFDGLLGQETTEVQFHQRVLNNTHGLIPTAQDAGTRTLADQSSYLNRRRHETIMKIMAENSVLQGPINRAQAKDMVRQAKLRDQQQLNDQDALLTSYMGSYRAKTGTIAEFTTERERIVSMIQGNFSKLQGGCTPEELQAFSSDIDSIYQP